jgi:hypothetical protein
VNGRPGCGAAGRECADRAWSGTSCQAGTTCTRANEWWWDCQPGGTGGTPPLSPPAGENESWPFGWDGGANALVGIPAPKAAQSL